LAIVTNVGAGCGGRGSVGRVVVFAGRALVRERTQRADDWRWSVRQSRVVLAPVAGVKLAEAVRIQPGSTGRQSGSDGGKRNSSPGRARYKPSNHCAGNAGLLRLYLYARVRISRHLAHETAGASRRPAFPAPSIFGGTRFKQTSGAMRCENADTHSVVVTREGGW